jgi:hypothetical protein
MIEQRGTSGEDELQTKELPPVNSQQKDCQVSRTLATRLS